MKYKMQKKVFLWFIFLAISLSLSFFYVSLIYAQEEAGAVTDSFDDATLQNYEHSQDVVVTGGVVKINPGNILFRIGVWNKPVISLRVRFEQPGAVLLHYHASDNGSYGVHVIDEFENKELILFKEQKGQRTDLSSEKLDNLKDDDWNDLQIDFSGNNHIVKVNDKLILDIEDIDALQPGGIGIVSAGEKPVEVDDLSIRSSQSVNEVPQGEAQPEPEGGEGQVAEAGQVAENSDITMESGQSTTNEASASDTGLKGLLNQLFITGVTPIDIKAFAINLGLSAVFAYILGLVYIYWGASLSNRRKFASNFILLTVTTTFIILVVRSSVALSLGLVGALSIVRFRAAIKEPEELAYLFLAIGLGIGLGDNQKLITTIAFAVAIVILGLMKLFRRTQADVNLHLNIAVAAPSKVSLDQVQQALKPFCSKLKLLRFDENNKILELSFLLEFRKMEDLSAARNALQKLSEDISITFLDNKGIW